MTIYYSASTGGFYDSRIHGDNRPDDCVYVRPSQHQQLMDAQSEGAAITASPTGKPVLRWPAKPSEDDIRARLAANIKAEAAKRIEAVSPIWRQLNDLRTPHAPEAVRRSAQIDAIREASNMIEAHAADVPLADALVFPVATNPLWPVFEEAA